MAGMGRVFDCEIQARMRDMNLGGHVDNVEAIRVLDEARLVFLRHGTDALWRDLPSGVSELVVGQRVEYHAEMRSMPFRPFLVRLWVGHVGRSSFTVELELRVAADHAPAILAETSMVLWDRQTQAAWPIVDPVRARLESYLGAPVELRPRPTS
jgi:acyl-CoA thioester hydrolase